MNVYNLFFIAEKKSCSFVAVNSATNEILPLTNHRFDLCLPVIDNVLFITDTLLPSGLQNLLCIKLRTAELPAQPGTYPLYVVEEAKLGVGFKYPENIIISRFDAATRESFFSLYQSAFMQPLTQFESPAPTPLEYQQQQMLAIPSLIINELHYVIEQQALEIQNLIGQLELASSQQDALKATSPNSVPATIEQESTQPVSELSQSQEDKTRKNEFDHKLVDAIIFWGNTDHAQDFYEEVLIICRKYMEFIPKFDAENLSLSLCLKLVSVRRDLTDVEIQKIYYAIFEVLNKKLNKDAIKPALEALKDPLAWERINKNLELLSIEAHFKEIMDFCTHRLSELKLLQSDKPYLPSQSPVVVPSVAAVSVVTKTAEVSRPILSTKAQTKQTNPKIKSKSKTKQDAEDEEYLNIEVQKQRDAELTLANEDAKLTMQQKFTKYSEIFEGRDVAAIVNLSNKIFDNPRILALVNEKGDSLLLIAFRNINHCLRTIRKPSKKVSEIEFAPSSKEYLMLLLSMFNHNASNILLKNNVCMSIMDYLAENTANLTYELQQHLWRKFLPEYMGKVAECFCFDLFANDEDIHYADILKFLHSGTKPFGPTFLHILLKDPNNISIVLYILSRVLDINNKSQDAILTQVTTPLLIAKHNGMNLRARVEEIYVEIMKSDEASANIAICGEIFALIDSYFIKVSEHLDDFNLDCFVELKDFFNLQSETNIIPRLVDDIFTNENKLNYRALGRLRAIFTERELNTAIRRKMPLNEDNVYEVFSYYDIPGTMLGYLRSEPLQIEKLQNFLGRWLRIEEIAPEQYLLKQLLSRQLTILITRVRNFYAVDQCPELIALIDIMQAEDLRSISIWVRMATQILLKSLEVKNDFEYDGTIDWMHASCKKLLAPNKDFSTVNNTENSGLDHKQNNIFHRTFAMCNEYIQKIFDKASSKNRISDIDLILQTFSDTLNVLIEYIDDSERLKKQLQDLMQARNVDGKTPVEILLLNLEELLDKSAKEILSQISDTLIKLTPRRTVSLSLMG